MYCEHFGLQCQPFNNTPDPTFYYSTPEHEEALATLQYATQQRKGFVLVTGDVGAGKTLIGRMFLRTMESGVSSAVITHTYLTSSQLLTSICREFEIEVPQHVGSPELAEKLQEYLLAQYARNRYVVVLLDEAQNLPDESFEALRMLGNLEADDAKLLQVCILGQPELRERFQQPRMKQINQRMFRRFHLPALTREQTAEYIRHRLAVAGTDQASLFTPEAVEALYHASGGTPRLINQLCDNALLTAYGQDRDTVDLAIVRQVIDAEYPRSTDTGEITNQESPSDTRGSTSPSGVIGAETFQALPDPEQVGELAMEQVESLREQIQEMASQPSPSGKEMQNVLNRQGELQKIVSGATTRWMAVRDRIASYRRDIQQLIDDLSAKYVQQQAQLRELHESTVPAEDLDEIRQVHMREIDRILEKIESQRAEFSQNLHHLESRWTELRKQVTTLETTSVQQEMFEPLCDRLDAWQSEVETFSDTLVQQVGGLKKQIDHAHEKLAMLAELKQSTEANESSLRQVTARLAELNRDISARVSAAEQSIEHVRDETALKSDLDASTRWQQDALAELQGRIDHLTAESQAQLASVREVVSRLSREGADKNALAEVQSRCDDLSASLTGRFEALQAETRAMMEKLVEELDTVKADTALEEELHRQRETTEQALAEIVERVRTLKAETASAIELEQARAGHEAAIEELSARLTECSATHDEVDQLRQDQDDRSVVILTQIESSRRAILGMIDSVAGRLEATRGEMERLAGHEQVDELRRDHEREITLLLSRLDDEKLAFEQRFEDTLRFCRELQSTKADAGEVDQLKNQQEQTHQRLFDDLAGHRKDLEYLVRSVNERCDAIATRIQNIPERFPTCEEVFDLRAKTESEIDDLNRRWAAMQESFEQLTATAAPAERLEAVEQELNAHLADLDHELKQRFDELNTRVQTDVDGLTRHVDQNVQELSRRVGEDVEGLTRRVDHHVEGLSRHVDENVGELSHRLDTTQTRLSEAHRQQTLHLRTIVNKMQEMGQRLFAMERTQPMQFSLTPREVAELKELLVEARGRNASLSQDLQRAETTSTQLHEASAQIEEVMRCWSENASAVQTQSDELRASAGTARELLAVMKRFQEALDAKLKSERWQNELQRGEQLAARLEQAVNEARTLQQQLKAVRSDSQEERERCGQEYEAAKSTADRLAGLVAQADEATHKFKGLLTGIMRSTSNISAAIESARVDDERTRPSTPAHQERPHDRLHVDDREATSVRNVQWPTMRTTA